MTSAKLSISSKYTIKLPRINLKHSTQSITSPSKLNNLQPMSNMNWSTQYESQQVSKLDEWSNSLPTAKRKRNQTSQSILFLYKSNNKYNHPIHNSSKFKQNVLGEVGPIGLYLAQLDNQLNKIKKINYYAIYQNLEYCAGVYQVAFKDIFNKLEEYRIGLLQIYQAKLKKIQQLRIMKTLDINNSKIKITQKSNINQNQQINHADKQMKNIQQNTQSMKKSSCFAKKQSLKQKNNDKEKNKQINFNVIIQQKCDQLKPIKKMIQKIQQLRLKILYFSLQLGYDVRQQGLAWILRQINNKPINFDNLTESFTKNKQNIESKLNQNQTHHKLFVQNQQNHIPKLMQFPTFLTQQQINFIISKYRNDFELSMIEQQKQQQQQQQKQIIQKAYENIRKERNRKLSMIKQKQLLAKILLQKQKQVTNGHKYLNKQTLSIMQNYQKIKSTTNQLIYQQTLRKLNRFCIQQVYSKAPTDINLNISGNGNSNLGLKQKQKQQQKQKQKLTADRVNKLMQDVKRMLADSNNLRKKQQNIKNEQQKQLGQILSKLRHQIYQGRFISEKRNPISVISCLVGWKKAKKILENEMNIIMPTIHSA